MAAPATISISAHGAAAIGAVVAKEITDPLILRLGVLLAAAMDAAGGGASGSGGSSKSYQERLDELSVDPQTGTINDKSVEEARTILQAEAEGIVSNPRRPDLKAGESNLDFVIDGGYAEIKTPRTFHPIPQEAENIASKVNLYDADNLIVIIDLRMLNAVDRPKFISEVTRRITNGRVIIKYLNP